jgi:hypothetical protein
MARLRFLLAPLFVAILSVVGVPTNLVPAHFHADAAVIQLAQRSGDVYVNGYQRRDGTYVQPHMRSAPDGNPYNNYSFPGNVNPYTGKVAPGNPDTYLRNYGNGSAPPQRPYGFGN